MKKLFVICLAALPLLFASCGNDEELNAANERADSLQQIVDQKDGEIAALFDVLSEIENNLTEIASRYNKVNTLRQQNPERNAKVKGEITDQLAIIDNIMAQNKSKIAQLNSKVSELGAENEKLQGFIAAAARLQRPYGPHRGAGERDQHPHERADNQQGHHQQTLCQR